MNVEVLHEAGYEQALVGLSLNHKQPVEKMPQVAERLYQKNGGHNKFLESMVVWIDITAARYWWQQFDTYRIGVTKQSESTMHTILKRSLTQDDFESGIDPATLARLNDLIAARKFMQVKRELPESFLQRRVVCTNYKTIRRMIEQRHTHRLREWQVFCVAMREQLAYACFLVDCYE
ncbi:MAG: hypothetical protein K8R89_02285 [Anaerolineae bacterium]|nr:hypothetical protein [Anaerolineae bacterium]